MNPSFREILELLNKHEVEYIVVGGVAAVIQGAPITTFDVLGFIGDKDRYEDLLHLSSEVAMTIGRFRVLDLEELIRQKKTTDRPKDRAVIELLEEALRHRRQRD